MEDGFYYAYEFTGWIGGGYDLHYSKTKSFYIYKLCKCCT